MDLNIILQTKSKKDDIAVCFVARDDKVLIGLRNYKANEWKDVSVWTVPGGHCEDGETFEETLRREAFEECGISNLTITEYMGVVPGAKKEIQYMFLKLKLMKSQNLWNLIILVNGSGVNFLISLQIL